MNKSIGIYNLIDRDGINKSIRNVVSNNIDFNTYVTPKGLNCLRAKIAEFINKIWEYNVNCKDMLTTSGSQQSINLIAYSMLKEGDTVLIEQPTYFGAIDVFKNKKVNLVGIDLEEDGLDLKMLEKNIIKYSPKLIYVTPTFNNPTGYAWSNENRKEFLEIVNKYNVIVLEDDPYSLINFTNNKYESLYKLNNGNNIIYLGTFSKLISPSVNVGYIIANNKIINAIYSFKESFDLCTNVLLQYVVLDYLSNNDLEKIVNDKILKYKTLMEKSINELKGKYKGEIEFVSNSKGGLFYFVKFRSNMDTELFEDGNKYYINGTYDNITRINICS